MNITIGRWKYGGTDIQTEQQTDRWANGQIHAQMNRLTARYTDEQMEKTNR